MGPIYIGGVGTANNDLDNQIGFIGSSGYTGRKRGDEIDIHIQTRGSFVVVVKYSYFCLSKARWLLQSDVGQSHHMN